MIDITRVYLEDPYYAYNLKDELRNILKLWNISIMMKEILKNEYAACA